MSAGRGRDSRLAAGAGAAAVGAAPGRRHPSSGRPGTRAGRPAESAAPPARSARRVHRARAPRPAGLSRGRRRLAAARLASVSGGAALRRSSPGLVPASRRGSAPRGPPRLGRRPLLPQARGAPQPRRPGGRGASRGEETPERGGRAGGTEAAVGSRAPASPAAAPPAPRAPRSPLRSGSAAWGLGHPRPLAPLPGRTTYLSPSCEAVSPPPWRAASPAPAAIPLPCHSLSSRPFNWAFSFPLFSHSFLPSCSAPIHLSTLWTAWFRHVENPELSCVPLGTRRRVSVARCWEPFSLDIQKPERNDRQESETPEHPLGILSTSLRIFLRWPYVSSFLRNGFTFARNGGTSPCMHGGRELGGQGLSPGPRRMRSRFTSRDE